MERPRIRIFNLARPTQTIVKTAIHELAHHVDWCGRGKTGHDKEFYRIYKALLEAAHALGEIDLAAAGSGSTEADLEAERDVRRALSLHGPFRLPARAEAASWFVRVGDGFAAKESLNALFARGVVIWRLPAREVVGARALRIHP